MGSISRWVPGTRAWRVRRIARAARAMARSGAHEQAGHLFGAAVLLHPHRHDLRVQQGHMHKEAGAFAAAEAAYLDAASHAPGDPDIHLQLGHLYKIWGRPMQAAEAFAQVLALSLAYRDAGEEAERLRRAGFRAGEAPPSVAGMDAAPAVLPELLPAGGWVMPEGEGVHMRRLGRPGTVGDQRIALLPPVAAIRGICLAPAPIVAVELILDGIVLRRIVPDGPFPVVAASGGALAKYSFNIWHDFGAAAAGLHGMEVRAIDDAGVHRAWHGPVAFQPRHAAGERPESDAIVDHDPADPRSLEDQVAARPSMVRAAARSPLGQVRTILAMRTDQLGDVVASLPAMRRLRHIFPQARIIGLLTAANADLARTLNLFDEILVIDFPDSWDERRRIMPAPEQAMLAERLRGYGFDLALDLATSSVSRPLLRLAGARHTLGAGDGSFPWLSFGFDFNSHDPANGLDIMPHSAKVLAMIEALGAVVATDREIVRRPELTRDRLERYGIGADDRYVLLHAGARIAFSRWPFYRRLAAMILERTDLKVVLMGEEAPPADSDPRLVNITGTLAFDEFDTLISHAAVMVGNDSGPKHLASLRGVETVTLFTARINWQEWGQETTGVIISRRVPCAGCTIFHDADECAKDFACIRGIDPEEVFAALMARLGA